ncbi:MAG: hypothetical protein GWP91_25110 [Rhodobacterales bacterium]|nr:hypothetical protein [Rhodobacterales bacterium]
MRVRLLAVALWALAGCTAESPEFDSPLPQMGWLTTVSQQPDRFGSLMEGSSRDGWVALHQNNYQGAATAFAKHPLFRARATSELVALQEDLAWLSGVANVELYTAWQERSSMPSSGASVIVAMAASCSGLEAKSWAGKVHKDDPGHGIAATILDGRPYFEAAVDSPLAERLRLHATPEATALIAASLSPLIALPATADTPEHRFWDPCVHDALRRYWEQATQADLGPQGVAAWEGQELGGRLFAPWLTSAHLQQDNAAQRPLGASSGVALGITAELTSTFDDAQAAREESRLLTAALDEAMIQLQAAASTDGKALLLDLGLAEQWRQRWHLVRARQALDAGRHRQALAYTDLGRQFSEPVGPLNPPGLLVVSAHAQLKLGHTREALDTLHSLRKTVPEIVGLIEVIGDLAVLQGLDRTGDSKEN